MGGRLKASRRFCRVQSLYGSSPGAFLLLLQKEAKQGKGEPSFPLCKPLSGRPAALDTNLFLGYRPKTNPYCTQMGLKGVCDTFLSPLRWSAERRTTTPVPSSEEGNYGAGKQILSNLRLARCKAADPWLWLAGLAACRKREGVPLPRSGGGWEGANAPAAPYKHRLAHAPGRRSRSGRAFRCVGVLGFTPSRFWALLASQKCHPAGQACLLKPRKRLAPPEVITDHVTNAPAASRTNWAL